MNHTICEVPTAEDSTGQKSSFLQEKTCKVKKKKTQDLKVQFFQKCVYVCRGKPVLSRGEHLGGQTIFRKEVKVVIVMFTCSLLVKRL